MLPDQVSNPGPLTYESGALPIALRGPACNLEYMDWPNYASGTFAHDRYFFLHITLLAQLPSFLQ